MKKQIVLLLIMVLTLTALTSTVKADTVRFVPIGSSDTGAPIITSSPATCQLYLQSGVASPLAPVWLVLAIDQTTLNGGGSITIQGPAGSRSISISALNFPITPASGKVPPTSSGTAPNGDAYPGTDRGYAPSSLAGNLGGGAVYYTYLDITSILSDHQLAIDTPQNLITTVDSGVNFQVLILGMGVNPPSAITALNQQTPLSGSTLVTTPEISTLILVSVALVAIGLYVKRKQSAK